MAAADVALCAEETEGFLIASIFEAEKLDRPSTYTSVKHARNTFCFEMNSNACPKISLRRENAVRGTRTFRVGCECRLFKTILKTD